MHNNEQKVFAPYICFLKNVPSPVVYMCRKSSCPVPNSQQPHVTHKFYMALYRLLNIPNITRVIFKQLSFNVIQEKQNLANKRNNLTFQPLMYRAFKFRKARGPFEPFLHTRLLNFWLCLRICLFIYSKIREIIPVASRKIAPTIYFFVAKTVA